MSKNHHGGPAPVPPGNRPQTGPAKPFSTPETPADAAEGASFQEQDVRRRLGDYSGTGEHPRQQPTPVNDGPKHSQ